MNATFQTQDAFEAIGLAWEGTYAQAAAGEIRTLLSTLQQRIAETAGATGPDHIVGISWTDRPNGFRYFAGLRVAPSAPLPDGMARFRFPSAEYAVYEHAEGSVFQAYSRLFEWITGQERVRDTRAMSQMELYPVNVDPNAPTRLTLMAPCAP